MIFPLRAWKQSIFYEFMLGFDMEADPTLVIGMGGGKKDV